MSSHEASSAMQPRVHSVKVPRLYKVAALILAQFRRGEGSVKSLVYDPQSQKRHPNVKALFALVSESANHVAEIDAVVAGSGLMSEQRGLERNLAAILVTELLWGKGTLAGLSRPVETVRGYEDRLREQLSRRFGSVGGKKDRSSVRYPRYVRVNTLKISLRRVIRQLKAEEYVEVIFERANTDRDAFLTLVRALKPHEFLLDLHVDNLLVFAPGTLFYSHPLYLDGSLLLQDKASCFSVVALAPPPGCVALDACAAPGMKTTQLAAAATGLMLSGNGGAATGRVVAVERDAKRCQSLRKMVDSTGANEVTEVINVDFLEVRPEEYPDVEYIVVDPSCSGSGMVQREGQLDVSAQRLERLAALQIRLLSHALSFPNVKRVVYSTCSVEEQENEMVVQSVRETFADSFKLVRCLPSWERRGASGHKSADKYVRVSAEEDLCNGFFVAVLQRRKSSSKRAKLCDDS